jgi:AcrR family transcriptional regulator
MTDTHVHTESHATFPAPQESTSGQNSASTREIILDTAERLFAENGVAATSIRDITGAAGVNLGAINYHFGTKQELVAAVFRRRLEPVCEHQWALLDEVEQETGDGPPRLEALVEAMIRPSVERSFAAGKRDTAFMRLVGRCYGEPNPEVERRIRAHVEKVWIRFAGLLARSLPELSHDEMYWRIRFMAGAFHHTLLTTGREGSMPPEMRKGLNAETMIKRLVTFAAAGMRAEI